MSVPSTGKVLASVCWITKGILLVDCVGKLKYEIHEKSFGLAKGNVVSLC